MSQSSRDRAPEIEWREIVRMRDKIAHHYFRIDLDTVWQTAKSDVPILADALARLELASFGSADSDQSSD